MFDLEEMAKVDVDRLLPFRIAKQAEKNERTHPYQQVKSVGFLWMDVFQLIHCADRRGSSTDLRPSLRAVFHSFSRRISEKRCDFAGKDEVL